MNIAYISDTGRVIGGGEISLLNLLAHLDRERFRPVVILPAEGDFAQRLKDAGVPVVVIPQKKLKNPFNLVFCSRAVSRLSEVFRQQQIGLVHANSTGGIAFLAARAARQRGIPFLWHVRTIQTRSLLDMIMAGVSDRIIVISEAVRKRFWWMRRKDKVVLIYNGVDLSRFTAGPESQTQQSGQQPQAKGLLVGTVGRYHRVKGYAYFVRMAREVVAVCPHARFVIVGLDDPRTSRYRQDLEGLAQRLKVKARIEFQSASDDVPAVLRSLDVFAFTSENEPFGRAVIEAMACSRAVVAFKGGGVNEIVQDRRTGYLVDPKDYRGMAGKIAYLLEHPGVREEFGRNARRRAEEVFDIRMHAQNIVRLYDQFDPGKFTHVPCNLCGKDTTAVLERDGISRLVRCSHCGLVYVDPQPDPETILKKYQRDYYEEWYTVQRNERVKIWQRRMAKIRRLRQPGRILDVGCGGGAFLAEAKKSGWQVFGTEVSDYAARYAREAFGIDVVQSELKDAGFAEKSFDVITFWHVLEHTRDPSANLAAARKLLKDDGLLIIAVPNLKNLVYKAAFTVTHLYLPRVFSLSDRELHLYHFTQHTLAHILRRNGWKPVRFGIDIERANWKERLLDSVASVIGAVTHLNLGIALEVYARKSD